MVKGKSREPFTSPERLGGAMDCHSPTCHLELMETENKENHSTCKRDFCSRQTTDWVGTAPRRGGVVCSHDPCVGEVKQF